VPVQDGEDPWMKVGQVTIAAGAGDVTNLRGLDINGGNSGSIGIQFGSDQTFNIQESTLRSVTNSHQFRAERTRYGVHYRYHGYK
jgi:hypothetical protein